MKHYYKIICLAVLALHVICPSPLRAEERQISENQAKAAFVFNVVRYVSWPPPHNGTVTIGILGKGPISREWQSISGKSLNDRKLSVIKSNDVDELLNCQVVVIEETAMSKFSRTLLQLRYYPILTVGDSPFFISSGGTLNVSLNSGHISFSINLAQARATGLEISSNLLKLATEVIK